MQFKARQYGYLDMLKIPLQCAPIAAMLIGIQGILTGIIPTIHVVVTANFIDTAIGILEGTTNQSQIYSSLLAIVALIAYTWVSGTLANMAKTRLLLGLQTNLNTALLEKRARLEYQHIENPDTWDLISRTTNQPENQFGNAYSLLINIIAGILRIIGLLGILLKQVWWAAVVILAFSIPLFVIAVKSGRASYQAYRDTAKVRRKCNYLSEILTNREAVDERALFGFTNKINDLWYDRFETARKIEHATQRKWYIRSKAGSVITTIVSVLIVVVLLNPVLTGRLSVGLFISLVGATFSLVQMMSWGLSSYVDQLARYREYLKDLNQFSALSETESAQLLPAAATPVFESLEFRDVSFKYPGTDKYVLRKLSLRMEAGKHYAFVGVNGSGKTTITKLIAGLYDNYTGEILLNGKEIRTYHPSELKAMLAIVYQDFAKYYISVRDNIALGDVNQLHSDALDKKVTRALEQVDLCGMVAELPQGLDTPLGKIKANGQDISGGEWQRLAMARAIVNPAPLQILDEPTAALDPISESQLYEEFERISRGKTTIFISHRLGSTKLADEIFVIDQGKVIEHGTHQELMNLNGFYAQMYESQRSWYN